MGAWIKWYERGVERRLAAGKSRGVPEAPRPLAGAPAAAAPNGSDDWRAAVPPLGLREYWYPALPARKVGRKPLFWVMLGDELVLFRDAQGEVVALSDVCPHRGASLSEGACFYLGTVSCPYHGGTFDGEGECRAFLTEGPDSTMVGKLRARRYPTRTLCDWVFVWMGEGEPAPIEEDVPPEVFEPETLILSNYSYWETNWLVAIENQADAHNCFYVHRNSALQLLSGDGGRPRTPLGPRSKVINGRALMPLRLDKNYYAEKYGEVPYQMHYPEVDGVWPLRRWRRLWGPFFKRFLQRGGRFQSTEEWSYGHHLPSILRPGSAGAVMHTRFAVPVKANLTRIVHFYSVRPKRALGRLWERVLFFTVYNWMIHYNFSGQDNRAASSCRYWTPEYLSPTDAHVVALRRFVVENSRDALRSRDQAGTAEATPPRESAPRSTAPRVAAEPDRALASKP
jgi:phenylpropionate dioxygenase-like ring-hydroxylating dioxygenase large terminal subunit